MSLMLTGDAAESLTHFDQAIALYDSAEHRAPAWLSGIDGRVVALIMRGWALWFLGHPEAALRDAESALSEARELGQALTLIFALGNSTIVQILCRNQDIARERAQEEATLAEEKGVPFWNAFGLMNQGCAWVLIGAPSRAVELLVAGIAMLRATRSKCWFPFYFLHLARAHANSPNSMTLGAALVKR